MKDLMTDREHIENLIRRVCELELSHEKAMEGGSNTYKHLNNRIENINIRIDAIESKVSGCKKQWMGKTDERLNCIEQALRGVDCLVSRLCDLETKINTLVKIDDNPGGRCPECELPKAGCICKSPATKPCNHYYESDCHGIEMIKTPSGVEMAIGGTHTKDRFIYCPYCGGKFPSGI